VIGQTANDRKSSQVAGKIPPKPKKRIDAADVVKDWHKTPSTNAKLK
jgi:hypothetical protein